MSARGMDFHMRTGRKARLKFQGKWIRQRYISEPVCITHLGFALCKASGRLCTIVFNNEDVQHPNLLLSKVNYTNRPAQT